MMNRVEWRRIGSGIRGAAAGVILLAAAVAPLRAEGPATMVIDQTDGLDPRASSDPRGFTDVGDGVLFVAYTAAYERELWRTDGTEAGTVLVADLSPGPEERVAGLPHAAAGGVLYFGAADAVWRSDGTAAGTRRLADLRATWIAVAGARLLVFVQSLDGLALWEVDPSTGSSRQLAFFAGSDLRPSPTAIGDTLYFAAGLPQGIWRSDPGGGAPTALVRVQLRLPDSGNIDTQLIAVGEQLFFIAEDPATGAELWRSDGTPAGTRLVRDINPGPAWGIHNNDYSEGYEPYFTAFGDVLLFFANDGVTGLQLWRSDGTAAGTTRLSDFRAKPGGVDGTDAGDDRSDVAGRTIHSALLDGRVYFTARPADEGLELWSTDGTAAGTAFVARLSQQWASVYGMVVSDGALILSTYAEQGPALLRSDATAEGTTRLAGVFAWQLTATAHGVLFTGYDGAGGEPWVTDGSAAGTRRLGDLYRGAPGLRPEQLTAVGDTLAFTADDSMHGRELWRSDGTAAHTRLVADLVAGPIGSAPQELTASGNRLFFTAAADTGGRGLWRSDLTRVELLQAASEEPYLSGPYELLADGRGGIYFRADDRATGSELWHSDGTAAGTGRLADIRPGPEGSRAYTGASGPASVLVGRQLLFAADDGMHGVELWRSDGTPAGTALVTDLVPGAQPFYLGFLYFVAVLDDRAFFVVGVPSPTSEETELWRTDGSAAGTQRVALLPGAPKDGVAVDGAIQFVIQSLQRNESALWRSDGTSEGTFALEGESVRGQLDFLTALDGVSYLFDRRGLRRVGCGPLYQFGHPSNLRAFGDRLLFTELISFGWQLTASDGNPGGTAAVQSFVPGIVEGFNDAAPEMARAGRRIFLSVEDGLSGRELWSLPISAVPAVDARPCLPTPTPTDRPPQPTLPPFACGDGATPCTQTEILPAYGEPGDEVDIAVRLRALGAPVAGVAIDLDFGAGVLPVVGDGGEPACVVEPSIDKNGSVYSFIPWNCRPGVDCTSVRALILSLDNIDPIADGSVLFRCRVALAASLAPGDYPLTTLKVDVSDTQGLLVPVLGRDGVLTVGEQSGVNPSQPAAANGGCQVGAPAAPAHAWAALLIALLAARARTRRPQARRRGRVRPTA